MAFNSCNAPIRCYVTLITILKLIFILLNFLNVSHVRVYVSSVTVSIWQTLLLTSTLGPRSFSVSGSASWNAVPPRLRDSHLSLESCRQLFKTAALFYQDWLVNCYARHCDSSCQMLRVEISVILSYLTFFNLLRPATATTTATA